MIFLSILISIALSMGTISNQSVVLANKPVGLIKKGNLFLQEIPMSKQYLTRVDILTATWNRNNSNNNEIVVLNSEYEILFRKTINSIDIPDNNNYSIYFSKSIYVEDCKSLYIGVYSMDGNDENCITIWTDTTSSFGKLFLVDINENIITNSILNNPHKNLDGSLCLKTYESSFLKSFQNAIIILVLSALLFSALLIYLLNKSKLILQQIITPEKLYLFFSISFGLLFLTISPPITGPDEGGHFYRSYQISQGNFFKVNQTVPKSLQTILHRGFLYPNKKTSIDSILSLHKIILQPEEKINSWTYDPVIPYIPQAMGIAVGRIMNVPPTGLLYLGRLFNLLVSILILYTAIKTTPIGSWIFFLISLMPMSLYLMASLSHDGMTISLSFLLIALLLKYALNNTQILKIRQVYFLFFIAILLALCKPPYFLTGILFLLIPVKRIGSLKKYITTFIIFMVILMTTYPAWYSIRGLLTTIPLMHLPLVYFQFGAPNPQIMFLLSNIFEFIQLMFTDIFIHHRDLYLTSFYANFGLLELPLPKMMVLTFLGLTLLTTIVTPTININLSWWKKFCIFLVFIGCVVMIEVAAYLYFTPGGVSFINGVQGRYFIPITPLFFLLFYPSKIGAPIFSTLFRKVSYMVSSVRVVELQNSLTFLKNYILLIAVSFSFTALLYSTLVIINRFYII
ncbi:MAG: DUF2142 domain-containing protein [Bacteroidetes bacterium]|nr:DUF2142 domain-containing protein [Bacteroidota bacterium]